ncbi:unnamed protein product [Rhizopus stolonifer]
MNSETLERICIDGICHCDWRITLQDCEEKTPMTVVHAINIGISGITVILGTALICHRLFIKGHQLFDINLAKGCFRPKPIDCMLIFIVLFNILRLLSSAILIADIAKDMVSRSFMYEFPWQFGYGAFALYLIGIAQTLADSHKVISDSWLPSPKVVDLISGSLFLSPFIINNSLSLAAGIMAEKNLHTSIMITRLLYVAWFLETSSLSAAVLYSGLRLIRILEGHLKKFNTTAGPRYTSIKTGIFKIRSVMGLIVVCLTLFASVLMLYGILRPEIMPNTIGSVVLGTVWNFLGAVCTLGIVIAVLINPKIDENASLGLKTSSAEKSNPTPYNDYSNFTSQEYSATASAISSNQIGGVSSNAFEELKLQQIQYQQVFQKHNNYLTPRTIRNDDAMLSEETLATAQQHMDSSKCEFPEDHMFDQNGPFYSQSTNEDQVVDDGETSQIDLVEHASKPRFY